MIEEAKALVAKLDEIENDSSFKGIWPFLHVHGFKYTGPNWLNELRALREAIENADKKD